MIKDMPEFPNIASVGYYLHRLFSQSEQGLIETSPAGLDKLSVVGLVVLPTEACADSLLSSLEFFAKNSDQEDYRVIQIPAWDVLPLDVLSPSLEVAGRRLDALFELLSVIDSPESRPTLVVASVSSLMQKVPSLEQMSEIQLNVRVGDIFKRQEFVELLERGGYRQVSLVESECHYAVRGFILDVFVAGSGMPVRIEFFDDEIESIHDFDPGTQRRRAARKEIRIIPAWELFAYTVSRQGRQIKLDSGLNYIEDGITALRRRAIELDIGLHAVRSIEASWKEGVLPEGFEHLTPIINSSRTTLFDYLQSSRVSVSSRIFTIGNVLIKEACDEHQQTLTERAQLAEKEGRLYPAPESAYLDSVGFLKTLSSFESIGIVCNEFRGIVEGNEDFKGEVVQPKSLPATGRFKDHTLLHAGLKKSAHEELPLVPLAKYLSGFLGKRYFVCLVVPSSVRLQRLCKLLQAYNLDSVISSECFADWMIHRPKGKFGQICLFKGFLESGFVSVPEKLCVISEHDIFPDRVLPRSAAKNKSNIRRFLGEVSQLKENDFVVHVDHGIAIYRGLRQLSVEGAVSDFLSLEYAEGARLLIPVSGIGKLQKYLGIEGQNPKLSRLGGKAWNKAKQKVKQQAIEIAGELINLYAKREISKGIAFNEDSMHEQLFAEAFEFEETPDQLSAISETLEDMARDRPMDRLVCGDVGFGKTEVAMRAAFRAASQGWQVALLAPTTVLVEQHLQTFTQRFADFPLTIRSLSRFQTAARNAETLRLLLAGKVDIVIGTHRLLQKDVVFRNLGLLIIDEEHRFGVAHKERLKKLRYAVDVLTLTATPIPRTLHMSLLKVRDLSVIETPPVNRHVTKTHVGEFSDSLVREAILRELNRNGQVFYIHNRVQNISLIADELSELVPEARVAFAHGQMKEKELEQIMQKFLSHEVDVLVSTTIVESGLDIPNANTLLVRKAENFGLAELYQLRGRIGRSSRKAYAYFLVSNSQRMGANAKRRLQVLKSLDDLGVGFRLALQDLEIRGAGNLLGKDQSGSVGLVGYDMYSRILREAIREVKSEREGGDGALSDFVEDLEPDMKIGFSCFIPPAYVPDVEERLLLYRRMVSLEDRRAAGLLSEDLEDRFGQMPEEVVTLLDSMVLRSMLKKSLVLALRYNSHKLTIEFHPALSLDVTRIMKCVAESAGRLKLRPKRVIVADLSEYNIESPAILCSCVESLFDRLGVGEAILKLGSDKSVVAGERLIGSN